MESRQEQEARVRALVEGQRHEEAVERTLGLYGEELYGYLMVSLRDEDAAGDVFQNFCLELVRALPKFQWRSSLRTWLYCLVRGVVGKHLRDPFRRRGAALSTRDEAALPERMLRTVTQTWRKTEARGKLWALCEELEPDDRQLLMLRVGRQMNWSEIALVLAGDEAPDDAELKRASARLRKRFERIKLKLREQMVEEKPPE